jgi:hypothetical protein
MDNCNLAPTQTFKLNLLNEPNLIALSRQNHVAKTIKSLGNHRFVHIFAMLFQNFCSLVARKHWFKLVTPLQPKLTLYAEF